MLLVKKFDDELVTRSKDEYFEFLSKMVGNKDISLSILEHLDEIISLDKVEYRIGMLPQLKSLLIDLSDRNFLLNYNHLSNNLSPAEKSSYLFNLFWHLITGCNLDCDSKIKTNFYINYLLFQQSPWTNDIVNLENIIINDRFPSVYIGEVHFENVEFNGSYMFGSSFYSNEFLNSKLSCFISCTSFVNNFFKDVIFENCHISSDTLFKANIFDNCDFLNCTTNNKDFLKELKSSNTFSSEKKFTLQFREYANNNKNIGIYIITDV